MKVLIVEENRSYSTTLARMVRSLGHEPISACDQERAIFLAAHVLPDLVLLGLSLDRDQFIQQLRKHDQLAATPVIGIFGGTACELLGKAGIDAEVTRKVGRSILGVFQDMV